MKAIIRTLTITAILIATAACSKLEEPQPVKRGINIIKTTPVTKAAETDSTKTPTTRKPGHVFVSPVYGGQ